MLIPHYNKSLMETQCWHRTLQNGKPVVLKVCIEYRCFQIEIELNEEEKAEILKMDAIPLNKYSFIPDCMEGCNSWSEIENEENFTEKELEEIGQDELDLDFLDDSDWTSGDDAVFELLCGCELERVKE